MWDSVLRRDVRVQTMIPGGTHVYAVDSQNQKVQIHGAEWNYVFLSSMLRSFEPINCPCFRMCPELVNPVTVKDLFLVAASIH